MGFYGKINNTSTSLVFDKIYPNRVAMEDAVKKGKDDGVFIGRYVLVNYEYVPDTDYTVTTSGEGVTITFDEDVKIENGNNVMVVYETNLTTIQ